VVPPIEAYSESLATHGYQNRVPIVRHSQAVSWVWLSLVNIYMIIWVIRRWSYTKQHVKSQSFAKNIFGILTGTAVFYLCFFILTENRVIYENTPHSLYDLIHYSNSSVLLNSLVFQTFLYFSITLLFLSISSVLAIVCNATSQRE